MTTTTYVEFLTTIFTTDGLGPELIAYHNTANVSTPTDQGYVTVQVQEPGWCFAQRDAAGQWALDSLQSHDLYLMVHWITYGYGWNTTGSGPLSTETERDVFSPLCLLLDKVCPAVTWSQAGKLFHDINSGLLGERGSYDETTGDGVREEYDRTYAYQAVKLFPLYQWLIANDLL